MIDHNIMTREAEDSCLEKSNDRTIHSGHFMVSFVHDETVDRDEDDYHDNVTETPSPKQMQAFDFDTANMETSKNYQFGPMSTSTLSIDASLTALFKRMTLAYSGKLTSPKWKDFKGLKLTLKEKVRLNNMIWREWHMQYVQSKNPQICQFAAPISDETHSKPEAIVLEGKYWKRRLESVTAEYKKWRLFFKDRIIRRPPDPLEQQSTAELLDRVAHQDIFHLVQPNPQSWSQMLQDDDFDMDMDLFSTLNQPFPFPNPKEMSQLSNADFIQPGLVQLQPNLDDFMDTLEPFQEIFGKMTGNLGNSFQAATPGSINGPTPMQTDTLESSLNLRPLEDMGLVGDTPVNNSLQMEMQPQQPVHQPVQQPVQQQSNIGHSLTEPMLPSLLPQPVINKQEPVQVTQAPVLGTQQATQAILSLLQAQLSTTPIIQTVPTVQVIPAANIGGQQYFTINNQPTASMLNSLVSQASCHIPPAEPVSIQSGVAMTTTSSSNAQTTRRASTGSVKSSSYLGIQAGKQREPANFVVPTLPAPSKTVINRAKQPRTIAPATMTSPSTSKNASTFLVQLLTGQYTGGNIAVKPEPGQPVENSPPKLMTQTTTASYTPILPALLHANATSDVTFTVSSATPTTAISSFQEAIVKAAASAASTPSKLTSLPSPPACSPISPGSSPSHSVKGESTRSESPNIASPRSANSPSHPTLTRQTPPKPFRPKNEAERQLYNEMRRSTHISAEQRRRCNIKSGFEHLHQLVPSLSNNPNAKISKAATLQKTAEFCQKLKVDRTTMNDEVKLLKQEMESLNSSIALCQSKLPATGAPVTRQRVDQMREMLDEYVRQRTENNWKFWVFSVIIRPLFDTYNNMVSTNSIDDVCRTVLSWLDQHCSLVALRPTIMNSLRHLCTITSILSDPSRVPEQAAAAVKRQNSDPTRPHTSENS